MSVEEKDKNVVHNIKINGLRNIIAHKEYCKYGTSFYKDIVEDVGAMQAWLDEQNNK